MNDLFQVVRIVVPVLRWPVTFYPIILGLYSVGYAEWKAPFQKEFFVPWFSTVWAVLALVPFVFIRPPPVYRAYVVAFVLVLGFLCYDRFVPFRYLSPDYLRSDYDGPRLAGGNGRIGGGKGEPNLYWVTGVGGPTDTFEFTLAALWIWPLVLASGYHWAYQRERRPA